MVLAVALPPLMGALVAVINVVLEAVIKGMAKFMKPKS